jgi:hypothetical protein
MVGMVATLVILGFCSCSLGITLVIMVRFIVSVAILAILAWGIVMVLAIILMAPLVRPITVSVFVVSVLMADMVRGFVLVPTTRFLGLIIFFGLLLVLHDLRKKAAAHISIVASLKELLKFEHVILNHSVLLCILDVMRLRSSKENLFA